MNFDIIGLQYRYSAAFPRVSSGKKKELCVTDPGRILVFQNLVVVVILIGVMDGRRAIRVAANHGPSALEWGW